MERAAILQASNLIFRSGATSVNLEDDSEDDSGFDSNGIAPEEVGTVYDLWQYKWVWSWILFCCEGDEDEEGIPTTKNNK